MLSILALVLLEAALLPFDGETLTSMSALDLILAAPLSMEFMASMKAGTSLPCVTLVEFSLVMTGCLCLPRLVWGRLLVGLGLPDLCCSC